MENADTFLELVKIILPIALAAFFTYQAYRRQRKDDKQKEEANLALIASQVMKTLTDELQEERDQLKIEANGYKGERDLLIRKVKEQEKALEDASKQIAQIEETYKVRLDRQSIRIKELEKLANGAETKAEEAIKNTDELKEQLKNTGALPGIDT